MLPGGVEAAREAVGQAARDLTEGTQLDLGRAEAVGVGAGSGGGGGGGGGGGRAAVETREQVVEEALHRVGHVHLLIRKPSGHCRAFYPVSLGFT